MLSNCMKELSYRMLCLGGNNIFTKKREINMYQYGGTIGPAKYPTFNFVGEEKYMGKCWATFGETPEDALFWQLQMQR